MNIESTKLSSLATVNSSVESAFPLSNNTGVTTEAFSSTLDTKIGELGNNPAAVVTPPASVGVAIDVVNVLPSTDAVDMQSVAASMGSNLPSSYKIKGQENHEAALATVTDTLKYISAGATLEAKALEALKNLKDAIGMDISQHQIINGEASSLNLLQNIKDQVPESNPLFQNLNVGDILVAPVQQSADEVGAVYLPVPVKSNANEIGAKTAQNIGQISNIEVAVSLPVQMGSNQISGKLEKKKNENVVGSESNRQGFGVGMPVTVVSGVPLSPDVQTLAARDLMPDVAVKGGVLSLPSLNSPAIEVKSTQFPKVPDPILQSAMSFTQSVQGKQDFNLNYFENALPTEKTGKVEQQISIGGEVKVLSQSVMDCTQLNKTVTDTKIDLALISKPLTHPEWNKDMSERIVWMASKAIPSAEIRLNPPHLGPVSVKVAVTDDQATVIFTAQHGATRDAIESSLPKLREMMGMQQLNLADVTVTSGAGSDRGGSPAQNFSQSADGRGSHSIAVDMADEVDREIESGRASVSKGLLSIYA